MALSKILSTGPSEGLKVPVLFGGHNLPPLVEIGLTDLPKLPIEILSISTWATRFKDHHVALERNITVDSISQVRQIIGNRVLFS